MGIFDRMTRRRKPHTGGPDTNDFNMELEELREEVPDIDDTLKDIERALREPMTKEEKRGCGCWG